jgi:group I intron endonuclease
MNYADAGYVYAIENTVNGHRYIGSTTSYKSRWAHHRSSLRRGKHHSFILQKAWDKYGEKSFDFKLLVVCKKEQRIEYENLLMPLQTYNVLRTAREALVRGGWSHTPEFKKKMSELHKGKKLSDAHRQKLSEHRKGRIESKAFRDVARARQTGVKPSNETKLKLSVSLSAANACKVADAQQRAYKIHALCMDGAKVYATCAENNMSPTTFYRYVEQLQLPLLGHKQRGGCNDLR